LTESTFILRGERFVVLSEKEYLELRALADQHRTPGRANKPNKINATDAGDAAEAKRRLRNPKRVSAAEVFRDLLR
jgi:hypothetical protein